MILISYALFISTIQLRFTPIPENENKHCIGGNGDGCAAAAAVGADSGGGVGDGEGHISQNTTPTMEHA